MNRMRSSGSRLVMVHPFTELYGSDRMFLLSVVAAGKGGLSPVVSVPGPGLLLDALHAEGAETTAIEVPVLRRSLLTPKGLLTLVAGMPFALRRMVQFLRSVDAGKLYVNTLTCPAWIAAARLAGIACVVHVHEAEDSLPKPVRRGLTLPLLFADTVIVNSEATRQSLIRDVPRLAGRIEIIYNGVDDPRVPALEDRNGGPVQLLLVGRLSPRKGSDVAVSAMADLVGAGADVELDLVGDVFTGYEWYAEQLHSQVREAGLQDRVRFQGFHPDVKGFLERADICLVPSRQEPFGNVAVEAMLAGRPVVVSRVQGLAEIVHDRQNGLLVDPDDPVALASAVGSLVSDEELSKQLADSGKADATERFGVQRYETSLQHHLKCLQRRPARSLLGRGRIE
jgi:glycosyltransferase involved in cell wall biosynthesis